MNEAEFDAWYEASYPRLLSQLHAMIGSRDEAEECLAEAFARAWQHRNSLDRAGHPDAWVRVTAHRLAISRWRRFTRRQAPPSDVAVPGPSDDRLALVAALRELPLEQRRALVLHHLADLSVDDVAAETGAPVGTVKARLSRGRAALAVHLGDSLGGNHV